jgi:DNA-directed RNA polymerase specialized sigma24 family protein
MDAPADPIERWLRAARAGSRSALGRALDAARPLLMQIAADELGADLRGKVGAQLVVARLSEEHQQALRLRNQEDLSFEEVGRRLGRSAEAARKLWARALARLAEALGESP